MGTWTTTPRTWVAGEVPTATHFNENLRDLGRAFADAWTSYTPTLTASTTNPTNWTQTGYYMQAGKLVICRFLLTAGASVTVGSGAYRIALPVPANTTVPIPLGSAYMYDSSGGVIVTTPYYTLLSTYVGLRYQATWPSGAPTDCAHSVPYPWAVGDQIGGSLVYEAS